MKRKFSILTAILAALALLITVACSNSSGSKPKPAQNAQQEGIKTSKTRVNYVPKNDVEGRNYNARLRIADDPSTLLWCTSFPTNPNAPLITVPIVGKLTSGSKRPYPTEQTKIDTDTTNTTYNPELPGPDGFYGSSGEYRYGFRPDGVYVDFYNLETYCTTEPTTFQREKTIIDMVSDTKYASLDAAVQVALKNCQAKQSDKGTIDGCPEAQALLVTGAGK